MIASRTAFIIKLLLLLIIGNSSAEPVWIKNRHIKDRPIERTAVKEIQDFLSVVGSKAVLLVHLCACPERIELCLPVRRI
jgi:hypothetical protein